MKKVIDMSAQEAKKYFLKSTSYFSMNLPEYFDFSDLLNDVELKINGNKINNLWNNKPETYDNINYKFNQNKDGKYAWRMFQLIHPAIYIDIVNTITEANNWRLIIDRFKKFKDNKNIICCSDIVESSSKKGIKVQQLIVGGIM